MQKIKAVIFDLDGTLANTLPLCIQAFRQSIEPLVQRILTDQEIIATFGPSEEGTIMALAPGFYEKGLNDYLHFYESLHAMCPHLFAGMEAILQTLQQKELPMAMVTGKGKHSTACSLKQFNALQYFSIIETGSAAGPRKTEGIQSVLDQWKDIEKEAVIYAGDAPSDIEACRRVGIPVIAAAWAETAEPAKLLQLSPDEIFYTVSDFARWLYAGI